MSNKEEEPEQPSDGPNLILLYGLLAFALVAAMTMAAIIVWPFHLRR